MGNSSEGTTVSTGAEPRGKLTAKGLYARSQGNGYNYKEPYFARPSDTLSARKGSLVPENTYGQVQRVNTWQPVAAYSVLGVPRVAF